MLTPPSIRSIKSNIQTHEIGKIDELTQQIKSYVSNNITGHLGLQTNNTPNQQWSLFFQSGSLISCSSTIHPMRRWCRQLARHCPQLALYTTRENSNQAVENYRESVAQDLKLHNNLLGYESLLRLVEQKKVRKDQIEAFFEGDTLKKFCSISSSN